MDCGDAGKDAALRIEENERLKAAVQAFCVRRLCPFPQCDCGNIPDGLSRALAAVDAYDASRARVTEENMSTHGWQTIATAPRDGTAILIERDATFSRNHQLRLTLTRKWGTGEKVCFIGHNPSTADHRVDDPTVRRWTHFARAWGYGGFVAVNLYPIRASDVREAWRWADWESNGPDWYARDDMHHNLKVVAREAKEAGLVVACWGAIARDSDWVETVLEEITSGDAPRPDVHVFGLTNGGAPIHPMARGKNRVPANTRPVLWRKADDA